MSKKKAAPKKAAPASRGGIPPKPAVTSVQRDLESARTRTLAKRASMNETALNRKEKGTVKVRATATGYYAHLRRRPGDVFSIDATPLEKDLKVGGKVRKAGEIAAFSDRWMELVDSKTPESISTANDEIRRQHDEVLASRAAGQVIPDRPDDVDDSVPTGEHNPLGE